MGMLMAARRQLHACTKRVSAEGAPRLERQHQRCCCQGVAAMWHWSADTPLRQRQSQLFCREWRCTLGSGHDIYRRMQQQRPRPVAVGRLCASRPSAPQKNGRARGRADSQALARAGALNRRQHAAPPQRARPLAHCRAAAHSSAPHRALLPLRPTPDSTGCIANSRLLSHF